MDLPPLPRMPASELLREILTEHADPQSPNYNECDTDPCEWCVNARWWVGSMERDLDVKPGR